MEEKIFKILYSSQSKILAHSLSSPKNSFYLFKNTVFQTKSFLCLFEKTNYVFFIEETNALLH